MGRIDGEISIKNRALNRLNNNTDNVYHFRVQQGASNQEIVAQKYELLNQSTLPGNFWKDEMKLTRKDWKIVIVAVLLTALIAYILFKTKLIKL